MLSIRPGIQIPDKYLKIVSELQSMLIFQIKNEKAPIVIYQQPFCSINEKKKLLESIVKYRTLQIRNIYENKISYQNTFGGRKNSF